MTPSPGLIAVRRATPPARGGRSLLWAVRRDPRSGSCRRRAGAGARRPTPVPPRPPAATRRPPRRAAGPQRRPVARGGAGPVPRQPQGRGRRPAGEPAHGAGRLPDPGPAARGRARHLAHGLLRGRPGRGHQRAGRRGGGVRPQGEALHPEDLRLRPRGGRPHQDQRGPGHQEGADPRPGQDQEEHGEDPRALPPAGLLHGRRDPRAQARGDLRGRRHLPGPRKRQGGGAAGQLRRQQGRLRRATCAR